MKEQKEVRLAIIGAPNVGKSGKQNIFYRNQESSFTEMAPWKIRIAAVTPTTPTHARLPKPF